MITNKLALSLAALLSISVSQVQARFLNANSTSQPLITTARTQTFSSALQCGECILGGYVFCAKGPEQYSGSAPLQTICCQNKASCPQVLDRAWNCSSKYENSALEERFRVCPFDVNQCGPQNLSFNEIGDTQCLRLNNIKKGNTCLYRVKSQCGVPKFMVNDTSSGIFFSARQLTNQTISAPISDSARCLGLRNQSCLCKEIVPVGGNLTNQNNNSSANTQYVCDCETALNTQISANQCTNCRVIRDSFGNSLFQCSCNIISPIQVSEDQSCQCQRVTDLITKASSLNCTCEKPVRARSISLSEESCKCVTSFNPTSKSNYLECTCKNAPICPDPLSFAIVPAAPARAPCSTTYPCECSNRDSNNTQCSCLNPSTGIRAAATLASSQCSCQLRITNSSFTNDCRCCLTDNFVRVNLMAKVTCSATAQQQDCICTNSSVTTAGKKPVTTISQSCNCTNPQSRVSVGNIAINLDQVCDCENIDLGSKACKCCVPQPVLAVQLQPRCAVVNNVSTTEAVQCSSGSSNGMLNCNFISRRARNNTYFDFPINATQCYCAPSINNNTLRACNCCVSDVQYLANKQNCPIAKEAANCQCESVNGSLICDCPNRFFFNQVTTKIPLTTSSCACFPNSSISSKIACTCCTGETDLVKPLKSCRNPEKETLVQCDQCANAVVFGATQYVCNCYGNSPIDNKTPFQLQSVETNPAQCSCINSQGRNTCDCCLTNAQWANSKPACSSAQTTEKCQCRNNTIVTRQNVTTVTRVNRNVTFNCRPTGCSGEICGNTNLNITSSCLWNNSFACFANAVCEYQNSTGDCGWTMTPAINKCITKKAPANSALFQNVSRSNATSRTVVVSTNVSRVDLVNFTDFQWSCNCSNSRFPRLNLNNAPVTANQCGCLLSNTINKNCDCCADRAVVDTLFLNSQSCSANFTSAPCVCNNSTCQCTSPVDRITYGDLRFNNSCNCVERPDGRQNCRCCLPRVMRNSAPVCSTSTGSLSNCSCDIFGANFRCTCNNGTQTRNVMIAQNVSSQVIVKGKNQTVITEVMTNRTVVEPMIVRQVLPQSRCSCLTTINGTEVSRSCNCCLQKPIVCASTAVDIQNCDCRNVTNTTTKSWQWNCGCTRSDNNINRNFVFDRAACAPDAFGSRHQCCMSKAQFDSQVPVIACANTTQRQRCQCSNTTDPLTKRTVLVCGCNRNDNGIRGNFQFTPDTCLCNANGSSCACCVPQTLVQTQIPRKTCFAEGADSLPQFCDCRTLNITQNGVRSSVNSCTCTNSEFLTSRNFNFTQSGCLCQPNNIRCECCVSAAQRRAMIPQVRCAATDLTQSNCSCTNVTRNGTIQQTCNCNIQYQNKQYSVPSLTSSRNGCVCNGTECACCLSPQLVDQVTEKVCLPSETRSFCSCSNATMSKPTEKSSMNCTCNTFTREFTVFNYSYIGVSTDQCLCRNQSACTCCIADRNPAPMTPFCNITGSLTTVSLPKCQCFPGINGNNVCNCTRVAGSVETYNNNLNLTSCNCMSVNRTNGNRSPLECSCCGTQEQIAVPAPTCAVNSTAEQCSCLNINDARGRKGYNCDCNYKNIFSMREVNFPLEQNCACSNTNTLLKLCQCCVSVQQYRDSTAPKCDSSSSGISTCDNILAVNQNSRAIRGNCVTTIVANGVNTTFSATNVSLNNNQCGCYNDETGKQICRCCNVGSQDITKPVERQCRAIDQLPASCECPVFVVNQTSANCSCSIRNSGFFYNFPTLRQSSSDCSCILARTANRTFQQCSCCTNRTVIVNLQAPVCTSNSMSNQRCNCRQVFNATRKAFVDVCDCANQTSSLSLSVSQQCSCLNQTNAEGVQSQNCICCAPNPPVSLCQRLALPQAESIGCRCIDTVVNGKAVFSCNCTKQVNATSLISRNNMLYDESRDCCCQERQDPITRRGFKQCNCTFASVKQTQNCQCRAVVSSNGTNITNCSCTDCNRVVTPRVPSLNQCQCRIPAVSRPVAANTTNATSTNATRVNSTSPTNTTVRVNSTTNTTQPGVAPSSILNVSCSCQVDFNGFCPQVDLLRQPRIDEGSCEASNRLQSPFQTLESANCKNQYEYLVAVVATNQDSSVLMQMQSYQFMSAQYIKLSVMFILASLMLVLY